MSGTSRAAAATSRTLLRAFGGLNETYSCTEAEAGSSKNFSSRDFPALSTRIPRRRLRSVVQMNGIYHLNGLLVAAGKNLIYNSDETPQEAEFFWNAVADSKKKMVGMGTKVIIFPDKIAFDTRDRSVTKLGAVWDSGGADVVLTPCDASGKTYTVSGKGTKEPENPADGQLFLKVNNIQKPYSSESVLEIYNEASGNWSAIELKWCRIEAVGIGKDFAVWDTVTVSGVEDGDDLHWKELKGDRIVTARGDDWVQVQAEPGGDYFYGTLTKGREMLRWTGIDGKGATMEGNTDAFRLERRVPDLDYLTECDNRLWGCAQNENIIYGCKLGDPTNWFSYRGIAEDSYAVTVGSDGPFTGAATCLGSVLFFKENALQPLRAERDTLLSLAGRCNGLGWEHPHQGVRKTEHGPALQRAGGGGRCAGWPLLPLSGAGRRPGRRRARRAAPRLRHRAGTLAGGRRLLLRHGQHRRAALPLGWARHLGRRPQPRTGLEDHRGRGGNGGL